jgi:hypothetical protein
MVSYYLEFHLYNEGFAMPHVKTERVLWWHDYRTTPITRYADDEGVDEHGYGGAAKTVDLEGEADDPAYYDEINPEDAAGVRRCNVIFGPHEHDDAECAFVLSEFEDADAAYDAAVAFAAGADQAQAVDRAIEQYRNEKADDEEIEAVG